MIDHRVGLRRPTCLVVSILFLLVLAGCGGSESNGGSGGGGTGAGSSMEGGETTAAAGGELTVFAASSLTDAFDEMIGTFEEQNPDATVRASYAGSSELLAQIRQGAPADVFASASQKQMDQATQEDLLSGEPQVFARNEPIVILPADNPARIQEFQDLPDANAEYVLAEEGVPIADYAGEILTNADAEFGDGFKQAVLDKIVSREANVRAAANRVALGEADATFVYRSDVTPDIEDRVQKVEIPDAVNVIATYPIATTADSDNPELAQAWVDLVVGEQGQSTLRDNGFLPPG